MEALLPWMFLCPFFGAVLSLLARGQWGPRIGLLASGGTTVSVCLFLRQLQAAGPIRLKVGGWGAPLGIDLTADGLTMIHLLLTATVGLLVSLFAFGYFKEVKDEASERVRDKFWPLWLMLWGALNALFLSGDLFNLYVILELIGLSAVGLVVLTGTRPVLGAGLRYLMTALAGSMCYLLGVALLYGMYGTLDIQSVGELVEANALTQVALVLMTFGLLMKTAIFPLHFWLPAAHANATAPVSALLSALVVKGSFFVFLRLWFDVFPGVSSPAFGQLLGLMGSGAILWGSFQALRQKRLKLLIAYSTVAQLGYLMFLFPVTSSLSQSVDGQAVPWILEAGKGTICQVLSHALAKASIFLSAGLFMAAAGTDRLDAMKGLSERMPLTVFSMALAAVSLMGLPPSGGFIAKWLITHAVLGVGQWWWAVCIVLGGLMTAGYMFNMLGPAFQKPDPGISFKRVSRRLQVYAMVLALMSIGIGIRTTELLDVINIGQPFSAVGDTP